GSADDCRTALVPVSGPAGDWASAGWRERPCRAGGHHRRAIRRLRRRRAPGQPAPAAALAAAGGGRRGVATEGWRTVRTPRACRPGPPATTIRAPPSTPGASVRINGFFDLRFEAVRDAFAALFDHPGERGAALCVQIAGETVVDLWAGPADRDGQEMWQQDTLLNLFSCTKTFAAVATLQLVGEGKL